MSLQAAHYQHPLDRESLIHLRAVKWLERVSKYLVAEDLEQDFYLLNLIDNVKLGPAEHPGLHAALDRACDALGLAARPTLFLDNHPEPHARCLGETRPMIVLSSGLVELLGPDELAAAVAHEAAHLALGHGYYKLLAENLAGLSEMAATVPGLGMAVLALKLPLLDWYRKADLSADRAAYLVMGDAEPVLQMIGKIAGGTPALAGRLSTEALQAQAAEADALSDEMRTGSLSQRTAYYFSNLVMQGMLRTQPWPATRVARLVEWAGTPEALAGLAGDPPPAPAAPEAASAEPGRLEKLTGAAEEATRGLLRSWRDAWGGAEDDPPA